MKLCLRCNQYFEDTVDSCPKDSIALEYVGKDPLIGALISDRYIVESAIGQGSSGIVYKALRLQHGEVSVALKVLHSYLTANDNSLDHFLREARAASRLRNPHIITIWDSGVTDDGQPYFVMDYLEGMTLGKLIREKGALPPKRALAIVKQICEALSEAHKQGIIHRDLKPENIMLQEVDSGNDYVKILDFGIADSPHDLANKPQLEPIQFVAGSPAYMSPEQCQGFELDARSDIYSLGIVVFEMLTGKRPFVGEEHVSMMFLQVSRPPLLMSEVSPQLNFSEKADNVIATALAKAPDQRQASVEDFWQELESALADYNENEDAASSPQSQTANSNQSAELVAQRAETSELEPHSSNSRLLPKPGTLNQPDIGAPIKRALVRTHQDIKAATSVPNRLDLDLGPAANDPKVLLPDSSAPSPAQLDPLKEAINSHTSLGNSQNKVELQPDLHHSLEKSSSRDVTSALEKLIDKVSEEQAAAKAQRSSTADTAQKLPQANIGAEKPAVTSRNSSPEPVPYNDFASDNKSHPHLPDQKQQALSSVKAHMEQPPTGLYIPSQDIKASLKAMRTSLNRASSLKKTEARVNPIQLIVVLILSSIFAFMVCAAVNISIHQQFAASVKAGSSQTNDLEKTSQVGVPKNKQSAK